MKDFWSNELISGLIVLLGFAMTVGLFSLRQGLRNIEKFSSLDEQDIKAVKGLSALLDRFSLAVDKLEQLTLAHEVTSATHRMEIENIKKDISELESRMGFLERRLSSCQTKSPYFDK
jgi:chromosome segregation ATPase